MSLPPPSSGQRDYTIELEAQRSWGRSRAGSDVVRLSAMGASISFERSLRTPLRLPLGTLQLGLVDPGQARPSGMIGRFPILKRLSATAVVPREQGLEGWLWTSLGGSALTVLGDPDDAPNAALLFTKPLGDDVVACFAPEAAEEIAARSPLGAPAVLRPAVPGRRHHQGRERLPPVRPPAPADRPRGAADAAPRAPDRPSGRRRGARPARTRTRPLRSLRPGSA